MSSMFQDITMLGTRARHVIHAAHINEQDTNIDCGLRFLNTFLVFTATHCKSSQHYVKVPPLFKHSLNTKNTSTAKACYFIDVNVIVASLQPDQDYGTYCQGFCVNPIRYVHSQLSRDKDIFVFRLGCGT